MVRYAGGAGLAVADACYEYSMLIVRRIVTCILAAAVFVSAAACSGPGFRPVSPYEYNDNPLSNPMMGGGG